MKNEFCSTYRGFAVTTRSVEVAPVSDWAPLSALTSTWSRRFTASFSVDPDDVHSDSWQQFPTARFDTHGRKTSGINDRITDWLLQGFEGLISSSSEARLT